MCASVNHSSSSGMSNSWDAITSARIESWSLVVQFMSDLFMRFFPALNYSPEFGRWGSRTETKLELASTCI